MPLTLTSSSTALATAGGFQLAITVAEGTINSASLPGSPPSWVTINATTGVLSKGGGSVPASGTYTVTARVSIDGGTTTTDFVISLTVLELSVHSLSVTGAASPGYSSSFALTDLLPTGFVPYITIAVSSLPSWATYANGVLTFTNVMSTDTPDDITVALSTDAAHGNGGGSYSTSSTLNLIPSVKPTITNMPLGTSANLIAGVAYSTSLFTPTISNPGGTTAGFTGSAVGSPSGQVAPGIACNATTGALTGTLTDTVPVGQTQQYSGYITPFYTRSHTTGSYAADTVTTYGDPYLITLYAYNSLPVVTSPDSITLFGGAAGPQTLAGCTTTISSSSVTVPSVTGLFQGQAVTGTNIPANSIIVELVDATHILISKSATANGTVSLTFAQASVQLQMIPPWSVMVAAGLSPSIEVIDTTTGTTAPNWVSVTNDSAYFGSVAHPVPADPNHLIQLFLFSLAASSDGSTYGTARAVRVFVQDSSTSITQIDYFSEVADAQTVFSVVNSDVQDAVITRQFMAQETLVRSVADIAVGRYVGQKQIGDPSPLYNDGLDGDITDGDSLVDSVARLQNSKNRRMTILEPGGSATGSGPAPTPSTIAITVVGVDDDIRVSVDGHVVQDNHTVGVGAIRSCSLSGGSHTVTVAPVGAFFSGISRSFTPYSSTYNLIYGSLVTIDCYQGWTTQTSGGRWTAVITWTDGTTTTYSGGGASNDGSTAPYYYPNGAFKVVKPGFSYTPPTTVPEVGITNPQVIQLGTSLTIAVVDADQGIVRIDAAPPVLLTGTTVLFQPLQTRAYTIQVFGSSFANMTQSIKVNGTVLGNAVASLASSGFTTLGQKVLTQGTNYTLTLSNTNVTAVTWKIA